ncbi:MAG: 2TM domain-containing protein [Clostridiales bacterium]|jgi:hypothetical protein|nr:2TM domain-containing protein [Clostridiales bacterium]
MDDDKLMLEAVKRVKARVAFRNHFVSYVSVNALLIVIYLITGAGYFWPIWPIVGWGFGLFMHFLSAYGILCTKTMEEEVMQEYKKLKGDFSSGINSDYYMKEKAPNEN